MQHEFESIFQDMDQKKTGMVEFQAFVDGMNRKIQTNVHASDLERAFRV